jgi:hypothetical protein
VATSLLAVLRAGVNSPCPRDPRGHETASRSDGGAPEGTPREGRPDRGGGYRRPGAGDWRVRATGSNGSRSGWSPHVMVACSPAHVVDHHVDDDARD